MPTKKKIKRRTKVKKVKTPAIEVRSGQREQRSYKSTGLSVRKAADGSMQLVGTAIVFDSASQDLGGFTEVVKYEAVQKSLQRNSDVYMLWQHSTESPLARVKTGTLQLTLTNSGLDFIATLPQSPLGQNAFQAVADGTVDSVSFGFLTVLDKWITGVDGSVVRELLDIDISEISPVTWPAYLAPHVDVRNAPADIRAKLSIRDADDDDSDDDGTCDPDDPNYDPDNADCDDDDDDDDFDDESEDYRCAYRCAACRSAEQVHQSNIAEDDPAARSRRSVQSLSLSEDDLACEATRCAYRCAACRSLLSGHFPASDESDDERALREARTDLILRRLRA